MKSVIASALILVLVSATVAAALSTGIVGEISSIDPAAQQIVVSDVEVQLTESTIIRIRGKVVEFEDLEVGMMVKVIGGPYGDGLLARKVTVRGCKR